MERLERIAHRLSALFARLAGTMVVLIAFSVSTDVVTRNLIGRPVLNSYELSTYLSAIAIAFGLSHTALCGAHIRVDVLIARLPAPIRRWFDLLAFLALAALAVLLTYLSAERAWTSLARDVRSSSILAIPLGIPQTAWAAGFAIFALTCVLLSLRHGLLLLTGNGEAADRIGRFDQQQEIQEAVSEARERET